MELLLQRSSPYHEIFDAMHQLMPCSGFCRATVDAKHRGSCALFKALPLLTHAVVPAMYSRG